MYLAFFVQQVQDAHLGLNEVDTWLIIIEINESPGDLLFHILLLLQLKHMLHTRRREDNRRVGEEIHHDKKQTNKKKTIKHVLMRYGVVKWVRGLTMLNCCCSFSLA